MWCFSSPLRSGCVCLYAGKAVQTWAMHFFAERTEEIWQSTQTLVCYTALKRLCSRLLKRYTRPRSRRSQRLGTRLFSRGYPVIPEMHFFAHDCEAVIWTNPAITAKDNWLNYLCRKTQFSYNQLHLYLEKVCGFVMLEYSAGSIFFIRSWARGWTSPSLVYSWKEQWSEGIHWR